jgi:hypothetical protein
MPHFAARTTQSGILSLMPERIENIKFSYILLSSKSDQDKKVGDDSAHSAERAVDGRIRLDPLFTRHLAGRNPLALTSKYSYVVDAAILVFAAVVVVRRFGWTAYFGAIIVFGVVEHWVVYQSEFIQTLFRFASPLFNVFDSVDATLEQSCTEGRHAPVCYVADQVGPMVGQRSSGDAWSISVHPYGRQKKLSISMP